MKREKRELIPKAKSGMQGLFAAARQLEKIKKDARIFAEDRNLLECLDCGLMEDVAINGLLITYPRNSSFIEDNGLRFVRIDKTRTCPACGATVLVVNNVETLELPQGGGL